MPRKKLSKTGKVFASQPAEVYGVGHGGVESTYKMLQKIESQVRNEAKYDHAEMRRADAARILAYQRVLAMVAVEELIGMMRQSKDKEKADILQYVFNMVYAENKPRMDELMELATADFSRAAPGGVPVMSQADQLKEKMSRIGGLKPENQPTKEEVAETLED